jgi:hypothetical protein
MDDVEIVFALALLIFDYQWPTASMDLTKFF